MPRVLASLRVRLVVLVALAVLPATAAILYDAAQDRRIETARAADEMRRLSGGVAVHLQDVFEDTRRVLVTLAEIPQVRDGDAAGCPALLTRLLARHPRYTALAAGRCAPTRRCSSSRATRVTGWSGRAGPVSRSPSCRSRSARTSSSGKCGDSWGRRRRAPGRR